MKKYLINSILVLCFVPCFISCTSKAKHEQKPNLKQKPNIVFIFADDLGYGDLGCFGAKDILTPNIDKIAKEGIRFTDFYSASSVCSPSRAALLTGRLPQRMGINGVFFPDSYTGLSPVEITIPEVLKKSSYVTGMIGKWHLGHREKFLPLQQGFDYFFGVPYSNDMAGFVYMRGNKVEEYNVDQHYITKRYTKEALSFIDQNKQNPFFLYVAHSMPHVPIYASPEFEGKSNRGLYGDVVQEIDWSVGQIINKLEENNLLENTLIIFSSDNGPWLAMKNHGGSAGILREGKMYTFDGGMKVPTVAMWKGKIAKNTVSRDLASQMDWFPTFAKLAEVNLLEEVSIDGQDISGVLFGKGKREQSDYLFLDGETLEGFRQGDWKVKLPYKGFAGSPWKNPAPAHDTLLFNLKDDPGERNNLYDSKKKRAKQLIMDMNTAYSNLEELPPSLILTLPTDNSHFDLIE